MTLWDNLCDLLLDVAGICICLTLVAQTAVVAKWAWLLVLSP